MGCVSSKQARCPHCNNKPYSPIARSSSLPVHHLPDNSSDSYHVVALTSSTLGSLNLNQLDEDDEMVFVDRGDGVEEQGNEKFLKRVTEGKAWSDMINEKIPKFMPQTPDRTPRGEPEMINAWELMEGLDDVSPIRPQRHFRSLTFDVIRDRVHISDDHSGIGMTRNEESAQKSIDLAVQENISSLNKPPWMQLDSIQSAMKLDPDVITTLRKSFEELSPDNPFHLQSDDSVKSVTTSQDDRPSEDATSLSKSSWMRLDNIQSEMKLDPETVSTLRKSFEKVSPDNPFHLLPDDTLKSVITSHDDKPLGLTESITDAKTVNALVPNYKCLSFRKDRVIVYFTSLRGVWKTYEDCLHVRVILKGLGLRVDERDMSMHSDFKDELKELLGDSLRGAALPRVFVGKKYIGGAEEIRCLNEEGHLQKVFEGCEMANDGGKCGTGTDATKVCEACGDVRFVPCETCSGSCKIYYDHDEYSDEDPDDEDTDHTDEDSDGYGFQRCPDCNENGLIRCPICCY